MKMKIIILIASCFASSLFAADDQQITPPKNTSEYQQLDDKTKKALRKDALENILSIDAERQKHLLCNKETRDQIFGLAQVITQEYPEETICCLGQSPAYMCKAAAFLEEAKGKSSDRFKHIAFSGKWYDSKLDDFKRNTDDSLPTQEQVKSYRTYLAKIGLSPDAIAKQYNEQNKKIVLVEYTLSGESLFSFLEIMRNWANEKNKNIDKAFSILLLQSSRAGFFEKNINSWNGFCAKKIKLGSIIDNIVYTLSLYDHYDDRVVPLFRHVKWQNIDPVAYQLPRNAALIQFLLMDHIQQNKP